MLTMENYTQEVMMVSKTKLQQISDEAWLVRQGEKKLGILNKDVRDRFTYITGKSMQLFDDQAVPSAVMGIG